MPGTQFPQILAGQAFTAALLLSMIPQVAWKSADTSRASTTTLTNDPDLSFAIPSAGTYLIDGYLNYEGSNAPGDLQIEFNSVGNIRWQAFGQNTSGTISGIGTRQGGGANTFGAAGAGVLCAVGIRGDIITPASGNCNMSWAQNTSSATATILHAGSWLRLQRVA